jgi:hypothetical protein
VVHLNERRREYLADKFGDLANLAIAALGFGQVVGQQGFSASVGLAGIGMWLVLTVAGVALKGDR